MKRRLFLLSLVVLVVTGLVLVTTPRPIAAEDILYLTNGGKIEGEIISETAGSVTIKTKFGELTYNRDRIERIERVANPEAEFKKRWKNLSRYDADGFFELGEWAAEQKLGGMAVKAWNKSIEIDPDHAEARKKLGYQKVDGKWLTQDEAAKEQGLTWYNGRWVTPEEKKNLEAGLVFYKGKWIPKDQVPAKDRGAFAGIRGTGEDDGPPPSVVVEKPDKKPPKGFQPRGGMTTEELLAQQKERAREAEAKLGLTFEDFETEEVLVHTTQATDSKQFREFANALMDLYKKIKRTYNVKNYIWPGKLQIYFFKDKSEFDNFAVNVDNAAGAVQSGGYFIEGFGAGYSKFHISMYNLSQGTLAHEMSHAFMSKYNLSSVRVKPWMNEGTAEFLRYYYVEESQGRHRQAVKSMLNSGDSRLSLDHMMAKQRIAGTEGWAYAISWSLTDFMISHFDRYVRDKKKPGKRFVTFLKALKPEGEGWREVSVDEQTAALEDAFGISVAKFEQAWKDHIRRNY